MNQSIIDLDKHNRALKLIREARNILSMSYHTDPLTPDEKKRTATAMRKCVTAEDSIIGIPSWRTYIEWDHARTGLAGSPPPKRNSTPQNAIPTQSERDLPP